MCVCVWLMAVALGKEGMNEGRNEASAIGSIGLCWGRYQGLLPSLLIGLVWRVVNSGFRLRGVPYVFFLQ